MPYRYISTADRRLKRLLLPCDHQAGVYRLIIQIGEVDTARVHLNGNLVMRTARRDPSAQVVMDVSRWGLGFVLISDSLGFVRVCDPTPLLIPLWAISHLLPGCAPPRCGSTRHSGPVL